jgi:hypothetical protein
MFAAADVHHADARIAVAQKLPVLAWYACGFASHAATSMMLYMAITNNPSIKTSH